MADIRSRRRRRVALLLVIVVVIVGGAGAFVVASQWKRERQDSHELTQGTTAYQSGDYAKAVQHLAKYLDRHPDSAEAQMMFAQANLNMPAATARQLKAGIDALARVVHLDPSNDEAARQLLDMYKLSGQDERALSLADRLLAKNANDTGALQAKAVALARLKRNPEALEAAKKALAVEPGAHQMQLLVLQLRRQIGDEPDVLVADAEKALAEHPDDAVHQLMLGYAYALANNQAASNKWLTAAADREIADPKLAFTIVQVLDAAGLYSTSLDVLARTATAQNDSGLFGELVKRLFEVGRYEEVVQRTQGIDPASAEARTEDLAIRAMALYQLRRRDEAEAVTKALAARPNAPVAVTWARVLEQVHASPPKPVPDTVRVLREAMPTMSANPYLHAFLGDAYASVGDNELALASWRKAAEYRPSWGNVRTLIAKALLNAGQPEEALESAQAALNRQPNSVEAAVTVLRARAAALPSGDREGGQALLKLIDDVQKAAPGEPQTLLLRVSLLGQIGDRPGATEAARALLAREKELPEGLLLQLAEISRRLELGIEDEAYKQIEKQAGQTPELALARAMELHRQGKTQDGLALLEEGRTTASGAGQADAWRFAAATYLDSVGDPGAGEAWVKLADDFPQNSRVQRAALRSRAARTDRAFTERVLGRLEKLMGDDSVGFRLEKARWLLDGEATEADATAAATLLREVITEAPKRVEPRVLLARALERSEREATAIGELRNAATAIPGSVPIMLELARLQQSQRQFSEARDSIREVLATPGATEDHKREAAVLLAQQGQDAEAIGILQGLVQSGEKSDDQERLMLASLYFRSGDAAKAEALIEQLLANQPTGQALAFALRFYAAQGRTEGVQRVVSAIESAAMPEADRRRLLAEHYAAAGDTNQAAQMYEAAANAATKSLDAWRQLIGFHIGAGNADAALAAVDRALKELPEEPALKAVKENAELVRRFAGVDRLRSLLLTLMGDDAARRAGGEALRLVAASEGGVTPELANQLRTLADANPNLLPLQIAATRALIETRQFPQAAAVAARAARTFPTAVEPAWLQAEALSATGRWIDVLGAAAEWRGRLSGSTLAADLMLAEANLRLRQPDQAIAALKPHLDAALADPANHVEVVARHLRGLIAMDRYADASKILVPLIPRDAVWRFLAMEQAASSVGDANVAAQWLDAVAQSVPAEATGDRTFLGQSWWALAQRTGRPEFAAKAKEILAAVTTREDAGANAWYLHGVITELGGDTAGAEAAYRKALALDSSLALAQNNLAMLVITRGGDAAEALRLAEAAVASQSSNVAFLDTLAIVQAKAGKCDDAVATIRKAIDLDPTNAQWRRSLADIYTSCGRTDEAKAVREQLGEVTE